MLSAEALPILSPNSNRRRGHAQTYGGFRRVAASPFEPLEAGTSREPTRMIRELYESLRPREERMLRWSAAAAAAAVWFSIAWRDAWVLLLVPMIGCWFVFLVYRNRRVDQIGHRESDDDSDFF